MRRGRLIAVVGPSGAGKDTLIGAATAARPGLCVVRRVITRPEEAGGEPFEGVSPAEFRRRREAGLLAFHWQAHGLDYGIPRDGLAPLEDGHHVIFNGSRAALPVALAAEPALRVILVTAPAAVLAARLARRGRETAAGIAARLSRASFDLPPGIEAVEVVNDASLETGLARFLGALQPESV